MCEPVLNGDTVWDWCPCARGGTSRLSPSVLEMLADVVLVVRGDSSYPVIDGGLGYRKTLLLHEPARDLIGRPLLPADEFKDPTAEMRRYGAVAGRSGLATPG
ncbi:MAG: hypothetical protein ACFN4W_03875, partial [Segatella oris]